MTIHEYRADRKVPYPFTDWSIGRDDGTKQRGSWGHGDQWLTS